MLLLMVVEKLKNKFFYQFFKKGFFLNIYLFFLFFVFFKLKKIFLKSGLLLVKNYFFFKFFFDLNLKLKNLKFKICMKMKIVILK